MTTLEAVLEVADELCSAAQQSHPNHDRLVFLKGKLVGTASAYGYGQRLKEQSGHAEAGDIKPAEDLEHVPTWIEENNQCQIDEWREWAIETYKQASGVGLYDLSDTEIRTRLGAKPIELVKRIFTWRLWACSQLWRNAVKAGTVLIDRELTDRELTDHLDVTLEKGRECP